MAFMASAQRTPIPHVLQAQEDGSAAEPQHEVECMPRNTEEEASNLSNVIQVVHPNASQAESVGFCIV